MKDYAEWFYNGRQWKECRQSYLQSQQYICERCGEVAEMVHHKIYITPNNIYDTKIILSFENLEALCNDCHNKEHKTKKKMYKYSFDENGNIIIPPYVPTQ